MMFPNVFHTYLTDEGQIAISIRSHQTRSDEFYFCKEDIEPALDDDPTDDIWSGSAVFQLRRKPTSGGIRIKENARWTYWTTSRQDIEILNAHLKGLCEHAPDGKERLEGSVTYAKFNQPKFDRSFMDELVEEFRTVIREEIQKIALSQIAPLTMSQREQSIDPTPLISKDAFIPSHLSSNIEGAVQAPSATQEGDKTLEAARKLKELKK